MNGYDQLGRVESTRPSFLGSGPWACTHRSRATAEPKGLILAPLRSGWRSHAGADAVLNLAQCP
jgi:hypothetical protein